MMFEFFRKPIASRKLMLARSTMPSRTKRATLTQEAIQILRNISQEVPWKRKADILSDFCLRMKLSGYSERYREHIIKLALKGWEKMQEKDSTGAKPLYLAYPYLPSWWTHYQVKKTSVTRITAPSVQKAPQNTSPTTGAAGVVVCTYVTVSPAK